MPPLADPCPHWASPSRRLGGSSCLHSQSGAADSPTSSSSPDSIPESSQCPPVSRTFAHLIHQAPPPRNTLPIAPLHTAPLAWTALLTPSLRPRSPDGLVDAWSEAPQGPAALRRDPAVLASWPPGRRLDRGTCPQLPLPSVLLGEASWALTNNWPGLGRATHGPSPASLISVLSGVAPGLLCLHGR